MQKMSELLGQGKTTVPQVTEVCRQYGLANVTLLAARPDLVPSVAQALGVQL
jgi:methylmalonyl-CoA mutase cobalamin-binding subunit